MKIQIINGPNLNLLGTREKSIYGDSGFEPFLNELKAKYTEIEFSYYQSNVEGELVNKLHEIGFSFGGVIMNAGALQISFEICTSTTGVLIPAIASDIATEVCV